MPDGYSDRDSSAHGRNRRLAEFVDDDGEDVDDDGTGS